MGEHRKWTQECNRSAVVSRKKFPTKPIKDRIDYAAIRRSIMARFRKVLTHLANR
jgi:hypothetical protein